MSDLNAEELIVRGKIQIQSQFPFFAYLSLKLKLREWNKEEVESIKKQLGFCTMAVDIKNNLYYNPEFVEKELGSDEKIVSVLAHEILHCALLHPIRTGNRNPEIWNIAIDLSVNAILKSNGFYIGEKWIYPDNNDEFVVGKKTIKEVSKKSAEELYDEIIDELTKNNKLMKDLLEGNFDIHIQSKESESGEGKEKEEKEGNGINNKYSPKEIKDFEKDWKKAVVEALTHTKNIGSVPKGMERLVDGLLEEKINWKGLLYKYITNTIPFDYTYSKYAKSSIATGVYMPSVKKEEIDILVSIDTSGSIGNEELKEFLTEIVGISKSFSNVKFTVIICDCEVKEVLKVENGNIPKLLNMKMTGGGGTSHLCVYDWISENIPQTKLLINFTDGYSLFPDYPPINTLWVLSSNGCDEKDIPFGEIIKLERN